MIFASGMFCYMTSLTLVGPATVSFISRLELVVTIVLAGIFLRERLSKWELIGLVIVATGIIIMRYGASFELSRALLLIILGTFFIGSGEVLIKSRIDWIDPRTFVFYRNIWMVIIYAVSSMLMGKSLRVPDNHTVLMIVTAAFFMTYLGRLTYLWTMRNIPVSRAAIIVQSQPFFAGVIALVFLDIFPSMREIVGGICIVAGVIFIRLLDRRKKSSMIADQEDSMLKTP
jgi:drug/metabolite transporter (DMT)-like permease